MNAYDYGRKITQMPGLQVEAWINPASISPRIKKSAQKMIRTGVMIGGYRGKARLLANQMLSDAGIEPSAHYHTWGVNIHNAVLTDTIKAEVILLLQAARMIESAGQSEAKTAYIHARYEKAMEFRKDRDGRIHLACYVAPIAVQIAELMATTRPASLIEAANRLADQLDDVAPIKVNIHTEI